ncbi:MAG: trimeric intracellular cation channel family protein [Sphingomonadales bacterium]|nr:trimeric intracellular cation channel family protein [Sphingomonadales bacterium]
MAIVDPPLVQTALVYLDLLGIAVFAISGALAAARKQQTLVTFAFFALITGVGGGTVRDLLIGAPVFWVHDPAVALACLAAALIVWIAPNRFWEGQAVDWFDAIGIAAYAVFGAAKALRYGIDPVPAAMMGVITACVGGVIRDVIAGEPSIIMKPELYVTAAALGSSLYIGLVFAGMAIVPAAGLAFAAGFGLRALAIWKGLALPGYASAGKSSYNARP